MKNQLSKTKKTIILASASLLSLAAFLYLALSLPLKTYATENSLPINVAIDPVLSITNSAENLSTKLEAVDALYSLSTNVNVYTNNLTGYTLSMSDPDGNSLSDDTVSTTIPSITEPLTISAESGFPTNKWAFTKAPLSNENNSATYNPLPTDTSVNLTVTEEPLETSITSVTFSTKIDNNLPAGAYHDVVYFTAVANLVPGRLPFYTTEYMQDFTENICNTVDTPAADVTAVTQSNGIDYVAGGTIVPSTTVKDKRDNQEYTVRKLADGNCWMTENLRYLAEPGDGTTPAVARLYQSSDAALSDNMNAALMSQMVSTTTDNAKTNYNNTTQALIYTDIEQVSTTDAYNDANEYTYTVPRAWIQDANKTEEQVQYYGAWEGSGAGGHDLGNFSIGDYSGQYIDANANHSNPQKNGVYYNYCAASGGTVCTDDNKQTENATSSICPSGWTLPAYVNTSTGFDGLANGDAKSFENLLNVYGITDGGTHPENYNKMSSAPLSFIRSGSMGGGRVYARAPVNAAYGGFSSASPVLKTARSYHVYLNASAVGRGTSTRDHARTVRCVLKGDD